MTAGVPPAPPVQPAAGGTGAVSGTGTVVALPPASDGSQLQLKLLQALRGVVVARTAQGTVTLQTPLGPVSVQTGLTPPPGAQLIVTVQSLGPPPQVTLQPGGDASQGRGQAATTTSGTPPQSVQTSLTQGSVLFATMSRPAGTPAAAASAGIQAAAAGRAAPATPTNASTPATTPSPGQAAMPPAAATPRGPVQAGATPAPPPGPVGQATLATLPVGSRIAMRLAAVQLPGSAASTPGAAAAPSATVQATATGAGPSGQTQIQSTVGQMTLATTTPLPAGTRLGLEPIGLPQLPDAAATLEEAAGQRWEALREAIQAVAKAGAGAGQARMMQAIPQPTPQMPATVVFFLQALRHGSMRAWIGDDAAETLGRTSKPLLDRLGGDFAQMQRISGEPVAQDWRMFPVPLFADGEAERLKLYIKDRQAAGGDGEENEADRFIVEANFTRLGPFQFDGLVRRKRLDLMIRTLRALPRDMQDGIGVQFADTVTALGLTGSLSFQVSDRFDTPGGGPSPDGLEGVWA